MGEAVYIHPTAARRKFEEFAVGEIGVDDLSQGALLIALEEYPRIDLGVYLGELDRIAERVRTRTLPSDPDIFRLGYLQAELFGALGYHGNETEYYDPRNSYLNEVIDRRVGIPITLSIVFLHIARKLGLQAVGVGLPGHYIVKVQFELSEVYLDPFNGGRTMSVSDIHTLLVESTGADAPLRSEHLRGWSARATLIRLLANLHLIYVRAGDARRATAAQERMNLLAAGGE